MSYGKKSNGKEVIEQINSANYCVGSGMQEEVSPLSAEKEKFLPTTGMGFRAHYCLLWRIDVYSLHLILALAFLLYSLDALRSG